MITKLPYLTLAALILIAVTARADDYAWGSTTGSTMVEIDATTGQLVSILYSGTAYTSFKLLSTSSNNQLGASLWLAENSNGTLYGMDNHGNLYTISTTMAQDVNHDVGFFATSVGSIGVNNIVGSVFISSNLLDVSAGNTLYQYNLTTNTTTNLGTYTNKANISSLAYNGLLYGVQFSPSPGNLDLLTE
jgi:hypothetical protein